MTDHVIMAVAPCLNKEKYYTSVDRQKQKTLI